jgi:hypothetical protein
MNLLLYLICDVLTAVIMKNTVVWEVKLYEYNAVKFYRCFEEISCLHISSSEEETILSSSEWPDSDIIQLMYLCGCI